MSMGDMRTGDTVGAREQALWMVVQIRVRETGYRKAGVELKQLDITNTKDTTHGPAG